MMSLISVRHTGQQGRESRVTLVDINRFRHEIQAQCPHGVTTVSDSAVKQTGHRGGHRGVTVDGGGGGDIGRCAAAVVAAGAFDGIEVAAEAADAVAARRAGRSRSRRRLPGEETIIAGG